MSLVFFRLPDGLASFIFFAAIFILYGSCRVAVAIIVPFGPC